MRQPTAPGRRLDSGEENMPELFETTTIGNMTLDNRFVRSATWEGMAGADGSFSPRLIDLMVQLAEGGVGLIISSHACVSVEGRSRPRQLTIYSDERIPGFAAAADAVHRAGGKIVIQIAHAGSHADPAVTGMMPIGPSNLKDKGLPECAEMTSDDLARIVEAFGAGAARVKAAGCDGIQIHAAHGYLVSQFMSPFFNKRTDRYNGSVENRSRFLLEIAGNIRDNVGDGFPVMVKMNADDFVNGGFTVEDMLETVSLLETTGIDAIELSGGTRYSGDLSWARLGKFETEEEAYYLEAAKKYKEKVGVPLMLVGGIRSYDVAERLVKEGVTDYIALSRPFIREPGLINRWKSGDTRRAKCLSDNLCYRPPVSEAGLHCVVEKRLEDM